MLELVRKLDDELKHKVADCAAFFEHRLQARPLQDFTRPDLCLSDLHDMRAA